MKGYINKCNAVRREIETNFTGLPYAHQSLINLLLIRTNSITGIVENITYSDLASLLTVNAAPGRKDSGTPQKQTIRSYLRTIQSQCGEHFKIISDDKSLKIQFPTLPAIYAFYFDYTELYTDQNTVSYTATPLINIEENAISEDELNTEDYTEPYTEEYTLVAIDAINAPTHTHAKIKPNLQPNNNNEKQFVSELAGNVKKTIPDDFQPSQFMIDHALRLGLHKVSDLSEVSKFIIFNKACGSRWANWDYVYLNWLMRDAEREQEKAAVESQQPKQNPVSSRRDFNERNRHAIKPNKPTVEDAMRANSDAIAPWECIQYEPIGNVITSDDFLVVG